MINNTFQYAVIPIDPSKDIDVAIEDGYFITEMAKGLYSLEVQAGVKWDLSNAVNVHTIIMLDLSIVFRARVVLSKSNSVCDVEKQEGGTAILVYYGKGASSFIYAILS